MPKLPNSLHLSSILLIIITHNLLFSFPFSSFFFSLPSSLSTTSFSLFFSSKTPLNSTQSSWSIFSPHFTSFILHSSFLYFIIIYFSNFSLNSNLQTFFLLLIILIKTWLFLFFSSFSALFIRNFRFKFSIFKYACVTVGDLQYLFLFLLYFNVYF